ncbi:P-type conjugative transfer protein TrbG [Massilia sp. TW-1]|uniref:P-type conjugative transfer protein TrbG n=1 Tax=Telluria antibiotica TaxID=2717319 RepID=A0ABX0PHR5_9BURK|nr:P-type conjugative transfer protein TrbG [Telluria antibiotica]NIA56991.1 P-type conjugative transfer protein TrbG [Telluria antibiotica]
MKKHLIAATLCTLPLAALAGETGAATAERKAADAYFSKENGKLTSQEKAALAVSQRWQASGDAIKPVPGPDGMVRFVYGAQRITVVCAVLQVCDIELQAGEQVNNMNVGDTRFTVEPAISGSGRTEVQHLVVKPIDVGLETSLIVTTNRRTYHIRLRSHRTDYMPRVGFTYMEDAAAKWDEVRMREARLKQERTLPGTQEDVRDLSFNYEVKGATAWKPVRVYNDGTRTVIQMPATMNQAEAPVLLVVRKEGGWLSDDDETVTVNYRVQGDRYIVDNVFQKAILIAGAGKNQERITITKEK